MARDYAFQGTSFHDSETVRDKECMVCATPFTPKSGSHKFCSDKCRGKWKYITGSGGTEEQYKKISGNWNRYISRLQYVSGRKRDELSTELLLQTLEEQDYRCALSGIPLTCKLEKGKKFPYNASVDRIDAGGPYTKDNIQLVCRSLNSWRGDTDLKTFIEVCARVAKWQARSKEGAQ